VSLDEFLDWERGQELRWEFDGATPVAMTGATVEHSQIATNIVEALRRYPRAFQSCRRTR
jgi:Uma2 family endonuclease